MICISFIGTLVGKPNRPMLKIFLLLSVFYWYAKQIDLLDLIFSR